MTAGNNSDDPLIGQTIAGRYRVISQLRSGGMGVTYRAWYQLSSVPVVIKTPRKQLLSDPKFVERFYREIALLQGMFHPHIVPIVDVGIHEGTPFVAMRFLPGGSLSNRRLRDIKGGPRPNPTASLHHWLPAIADALDYVHSQGVVHRDVKPANIFFDAFWGAYLGDFGIAKVVAESDTFDKEHTLTATHMGVGTQEYMAPEQFTPKAVLDGRTDQYALAVTAYEMLAGHRPFTGDSAHIIVEVTTHAVPPLTSFRKDLPQSLVDAVHRGLVKHPAGRFATCTEFATAALRDVPPPDDESFIARLLCPSCVTILRLNVDDAGRLGSCPRCSAAIIVAPDLTALWLRHEASAASLNLAPRPLSKQMSPEDSNDDHAVETATQLTPAESTDQQEQDRREPRRTQCSFELSLLTRACVVTTLAMAFAAGLLALWIPPPPEQPRYLYISFLPPDDNFEEFEPDQPIENTEQTDAVSEMVFLPDWMLVEDVSLIGHSSDNTASPAGKFTSFESEAPPAADMMVTISTAGGTAPTGLGGRADATAIAAKGGGGRDTEAAVDRALKWLIEHQLDDGSWSFDLNDCPKCRGRCSRPGRQTDRAGATAMALLPFLGRGYTHVEGPYKKQIERGVAFLAARAVANNGTAYKKDAGNGALYIQGLAGIALSECYCMTQDNRLAQPAQLVLNHIMAAQDQRGGGWRYSPGQAGDLSVTGWQIIALKSGNMAYLQVNPLTIKKAVEFLNFVQADSGATYGYTDNSSQSPARSAVGLLCRMYLGWKKDNPALQDGVARLARIGPTNDIDYDYHATEIIHHIEGDIWVAWNNRMKRMLLQTQAKDGHENGSWCDGFDGNPEAINQGGRLYCTSLATMICEVYYRHMPIYRLPPQQEEFKE